MRIIDRKTIQRIASNNRIVSGNCDFLYGVNNSLAFLINIKIRKAAGPVIACVQQKFLTGSVTISQQNYGNIIGTDAVLIIPVSPSFCYSNAGLFRCVAVGHIITIDNCRVTLNGILCNGITDQAAAVFILG